MRNFSASVSKYSVFLTTFLLLAFSVAGESHFPDWDFKKNITIHSSLVEEDLTDYPLLVDVDDPDLAKATIDDILFSADDGTQLAHEIELLDDSHLVAWVKLPTLSSSVDSNLQIYYGNAAAPNQEDPENVWDSSYLAVYHLDEISGDSIDSTANNNDGNPQNGVTQDASGLIDGADLFDGTNDRTDLPQVFTTETQFTFEGLVLTDNVQGYTISQRDSSRNGAFIQYYPTEENFQFYVGTGTAKQLAGSGVWHYVVGTFDGSTARLYIDGNSPATASGTISWPALDTILADRASSGRELSGMLDEIRLSDVARSQGYIETVYNNINGAFVTVGPEQLNEFNYAPEISAPSPANTATDIPLNPTLEISISDVEGDSVDWTVEVYDDFDPGWIIIDSGTDADGSAALSVPTSTITDYNTEYSWKVTATDLGATTEGYYSFTTRGPSNYQADISGLSPADGNIDIPLAPTLEADIGDLDGDSIDWTVELYEGSWTVLDAGTSGPSIHVTVPAPGASAYDSMYTWRVTATDTGTGLTSEQIASFTTEPANHAPDITSVTPTDTEENVEVDTTLDFIISDIESDSFDWSVELFDGSWTVITSGTDADGYLDTSVPTGLTLAYETEYQWRINATDMGSGQTTTSEQNFTTRPENFLPTITAASPAANETGVDFDAELSAYFDDADGDLLDITIYADTGSGYVLLETFSSVAAGTYSADPDTALPFTDYSWKAVVSDGTDTVEEEFSFKTGGDFDLKFSVSLTDNNAEVFPLMGDIDGDGTQEIVFGNGDTIYALNGETGAVEWTAPESYWKAIELADIDNDGTPEVLYAVEGPRVRALNGDGTYIWTSELLGGDSFGMFPIVTFDIDGDGYPSIYVATEDSYPDPYSGDDSQYDGALYMLDHNGNVERSTWIHHPCWGGLTLGDANFDGIFEIYVSDRRTGYHSFPARGLQGYNAHTLEKLWDRPDLQHSSPMGVLADVFGDEELEMIATPITLKGPVVMDAMTGETIVDYQSLRLPTHATPSVYDFDHDGNLEILYATSYPTSAPKKFVVFDLVSGELEYEEYFDHWIAWPSEFGDVTGDGNMEILLSTGTQGSGSTFPLIIYDDEYNVLDSITITGAGQLLPAKLYDTDSDGLQEIVVTGINGQINVYETMAPVPSPAPRTWNQKYSEYRQGAAEYVPPPGVDFPVIREAFPENGSSSISTEPVLSALVYDLQQDTIDITIEGNDGSGWQVLETYIGVSRGVFTADTTGLFIDMDEEYQWRITAVDEHGNTNVNEFTFETIESQPWDFPDWDHRMAIVIDADQVEEDLNEFPVLVYVDESDLDSNAQADGDDILFTLDDGITQLSHEIESYDSPLVAWVEVPFLSSTEDTTLYMYYGNPSAGNQENAEAVWDANYLAVHHMSQDSGNLLDSTSNNNDGTPLNGVLQGQAGEIDGAVTLDGNNDRITLPQIFSTETEFTFEAWLNSGDQRGYALSQRDGSGNGAFIQYFEPENNFQLFMPGGSLKLGASTNEWHHVVGTFDGVNAMLMVDGGTPVTGANSINWPAEAMFIGDRSLLSREFLGGIDEVRFSDIARTQGYIQTSFNNQNNPSVFMAVGEQESPSQKPVIFNEMPEDGTIDVDPTISELSFELVHYSGKLMNYTVTTSPDIGSDSATDVADGVFSVSVGGLEPNTMYTWEVTANDDTKSTTKEYVFQTQFSVDINIVGDGVVGGTHAGTHSTGDTVELNATPDSGWEFLGFAGDFESADADVGVVISGYTNVTAIFVEENSLIMDSDFDMAQYIDLRDNSPFQDWYESRNDDPTILDINTENISGNDGYKAKLEANTKDNAYLTQEFEAQSGFFRLQWDIFVDNITDSAVYVDRAAIMFIGDHSTNNWRGPNYGAAQNFAWLAFYKDGGAETGTMDLVATNFAGEEIVLTEMNLDQWYTMKVIGNTDTDTYDVFVDDVLIAQGISSRRAKDNVTHISFAQWNDGAGTFYIDNVQEGEPVTCVDSDSDGFFGSGGACGPFDCNDGNDTINPGVEEICDNGIDDNCNGILDTDELSCYDGALIVDNEFDSSSDSDDLRNNTMGQDWYESRGNMPELAQLYSGHISGNVGNKLFMNGDESGDAYLSQEFPGPQTGPIGVEWDVYVDEILDITGNPDRTGWVVIGDDSRAGRGPNVLGSERFVTLAFEMATGSSSGQMDLMARDNDDTWGVFTTLATGLNLDQWYKIGVVLNLDTDSYEVYVDDVMVGTMNATTPKDSVTHISFVNMNDGAGKYYIDNAWEMPVAPECTDADNDTYAIEGDACGPIDCDDTNASINPGATEVCDNGVDDNCDGAVDEGCLDCENPNNYFDDFDTHDTDYWNTTDSDFIIGSGELDCNAGTGFNTAMDFVPDWDFNGNEWTIEFEVSNISEFLVAGPHLSDSRESLTAEPFYYMVARFGPYGDTPLISLDEYWNSTYSQSAIVPDISSTPVIKIHKTNNINGTFDYEFFIDGVSRLSATSQNIWPAEFDKLMFRCKKLDNNKYSFDWINVSVCQTPCEDSDGDGYDSAICGGNDCDDTNASINPGATEVCDEVDNDCDAEIDEEVMATYYHDFDSDTFGNASVSMDACEAPVDYVSDDSDCNDDNDTIYPGAAEVCGNSIDDNCDGEIDEDCVVCDNPYNYFDDFTTLDSNVWTDEHNVFDIYNGTELRCNPDGVDLRFLEFTDFDDFNRNDYVIEYELTWQDDYAPHVAGFVEDKSIIHSPSQTYNIYGFYRHGTENSDLYFTEVVNDSFAHHNYEQNHVTGYTGKIRIEKTNLPNGHYNVKMYRDGVLNFDLNSSYNWQHPDLVNKAFQMVFLCNLNDNTDWRIDWINVSVCQTACEDADHDGYDAISCGGNDCDDNNASINPGATEVCDEVDNNCDGSVDEGLITTYYHDFDSDTFGNASVSIDACVAPGAYVVDNTDCDDSDLNVNPGQAEICDNSVDDDCDGDIDMSDDECGECTTGETRACPLTLGVCAGVDESCVANAWAGCDYGTDYEVTETLCDGLDNDCDGDADSGLTDTYYHDSDSDTFGNHTDSQEACVAPTDYVVDDNDCNDDNDTIYPGAAEVCNNSVDDDCDGMVDEDCGECTTGETRACPLQDGVCAGVNQSCVANAWVACDYGTDYEFAETLCDGLDNDCDGDADLGLTDTFYHDSDSDTFGNHTDSQEACIAPTDHVLDDNDCNDDNDTIYPGATEVCDNSVDDDCDGLVDEDCASSCEGADADGDGEVDADDLMILATNFGSVGCVEGNSYCSGADMNQDGEVDVLDLFVLSNNFGRTDC